MLTILSSTNESQFQGTFTSCQSLLETSNLESNAHDEDDFKSGNHDDHQSILDDLIAYGSQEFDSYEDPRAYYPNIAAQGPKAPRWWEKKSARELARKKLMA